MPLVQIPEEEKDFEYENGADMTRNIATIGLILLSLQFGLICLSGYHKVIAWCAGFSFVAWLYFFIDLHRIRFSHTGAVCFGDMVEESGQAGDVTDSSPYLIKQGRFLSSMIWIQWIFIGLLVFGLTS